LPGTCARAVRVGAAPRRFGLDIFPFFSGEVPAQDISIFQQLLKYGSIC
jgi:hypothetical protein